MKYSFIIPAYNEESLIADCIKSVQRQKGTSFEVIVVDNGSNDKTAEIAKRLNAIVVKESKKGISYARNKGAREAKGKYLCFIDADGVVSRRWLMLVKKETSKRSKVDVVIGMNIFTHESIVKAIWYNTYTLFAHVGLVMSSLFFGKTYIPGNNIAIRKELFEKIGGFEPVVAEDIWLGRKLKKYTKSRVVFNPLMIIKYSSRGFDSSGYVRTLYYWIQASLRKRSQEGYSYKRKV
jgi:glycosyltransferase involved in cell wall biosynthesis